MSSSNRGVLALASSLIGLFREAAPEASFRLLLGHRRHETVSLGSGAGAASVEVVNYRLSPRSALREHLLWILALAFAYRLVPVKAVRRSICGASPWIDSLAHATLVGDVHGGDSFSDIYGMRRFLLGYLAALSVLLVRGGIVQFPQTYGPYKSWLARRLARQLLRHSSTIIARDRQSQEVAQALVGRKRSVLLSPDVAFSLATIVPSAPQFDPPLQAIKAGTAIGLNVNGLMYHGGYTRDNMFGLELDYPEFLAALVPALLREHSGELWLIPHTFAAPGSVESDPEASRTLRASLAPEIAARTRLVAADYDQCEIKGVIGLCDFFVGSRMHSCIAALSQGIPCVAVAYSQKFIGVFASVGMSDWVIDGRTISSARAVQQVVELYRRRNDVRAELRAHAQRARNELAELFRALVAGATGRLPRDERRTSRRSGGQLISNGTGIEGD